MFLGMRSVWWERYFETLLEMDIFSKNGECIFNEDGGGSTFRQEGYLEGEWDILVGGGRH